MIRSVNCCRDISFHVQAHQAEEVSEALKNSLSILREQKNAKEFRQIMQLDDTDGDRQEEIEKVDAAMSQVGLSKLCRKFLCTVVFEKRFDH